MDKLQQFLNKNNYDYNEFIKFKETACQLFNNSTNIIDETNNCEIKEYKESGGNSLILIFDYMVIKIENNRLKSDEIKLYNEYNFNNNPIIDLLLFHHKINSNFYLTVYPKLKTLNTIKQGREDKLIIDNNDLKKLIKDTVNNIYELSLKNIIHGDVSIYNIGFDKKYNKFVLFDFGEITFDQPENSVFTYDIKYFYDNLESSLQNNKEILNKFKKYIKESTNIIEQERRFLGKIKIVKVELLDKEKLRELINLNF
jgi:hypothetical protein